MALASRGRVLLRGTPAGPAARAFVVGVVILVVVAAGRPPTLASGLGVLFGRSAAGAVAGAITGRAVPAVASADVFVFALVVVPIVVVPAATAVRRLAAPAGDLALLVRVHRGEPATAVLVGVLGVGMSGAGVTVRVLVIAGGVMPLRLTVVMGGRLVVEGRLAVVGGLAALAAGLGGVELVGRALPMGCSASLGGDLPLLFGVHRRESAPASLCHDRCSNLAVHVFDAPRGAVALNGIVVLAGLAFRAPGCDLRTTRKLNTKIYEF